jgi:hypothetical protein
VTLVTNGFPQTNKKGSHVCMGLATIEWKFIVTLVLKFLVPFAHKGNFGAKLRGFG